MTTRQIIGMAQNSRDNRQDRDFMPSIVGDAFQKITNLSIPQH
jgi:hypothetical protein